jgi:hypothetical protein
MGKPGSGKNLSPEIISYIIMKRNRERHILGWDSENLANNDKNDLEINSSDTQKEEINKLAKHQGTIGPHCLLFDSFFESGNLEKAEYVSPTEYNLYLNVDTNTKGHQ